MAEPMTSRLEGVLPKRSVMSIGSGRCLLFFSALLPAQIASERGCRAEVEALREPSKR